MRVLSLSLLLLAACGRPADDPDAGGVSADEARQLNEAAAMLDANSVSLDAVTNCTDAAEPTDQEPQP